jgi:eukaryotic-like serine/threonine-protein kinase
MPLPSGTQLGPYEVLAPLGAGGMGEVYRARDARLAREVAIKVLPPSFSQDAERLRRFEHEAKATGALNHPNVLAVYDTGHHDGAPYVVSELLEGETLRDRMAGGALPLRKAVEIGAQVARGLAAAHEKGIVHRDLKPENVFITDEGHVKILDFGLAKLTQLEASEESQSPTRTRQTDPGVVLGTAGYMSPEQVRGAPVDHRSDIFSFGTILYEMLTGRRAFKKETSAETMAAILREDPPDLTETGKALPPALERIVAHCLEKNAQERFASARDLAFDLESLSERSDATTTARALQQSGLLRRRALWAAAWLVSIAAAIVTAFMLGKRASVRPEPRYTQLSSGHGNVASGFFSSDGASIVYSARWNGATAKVYSMRLDLAIEQALGLEGEVVGVAGGEVAFLRSDGTLARAPLSGGGARDVAQGIIAAAWSSDGSRFAIVRRVGAKHVLEYPIGTALHETNGDFSGLRISPDGTRVATVERPSLGVVGGWVTVVDANGAKHLTQDLTLVSVSPIWSPDGGEIWFVVSDSGDWSIRGVSLAGRERILMKTAAAPHLQDTLKDGRVLLSLGQLRREVAGLAPGENVERDLTVRGYSQSWDISEDGRRYVVSDDIGDRKASAFLGSLDGSPLVRLGAGGPNSLSADGRSVLVWKDSAAGIGTALAILPTGAGEPRGVPRGTVRSYLDARFLPDGRRILMSASEQDRPRRLFVQDLPDGPPKPITPEGVFTEYAFATPDGAWVAAGTDYDAAPYLLYPVAGGEPRPIPGLEKGDQPIRFSADGRRLFVRYGYAADSTRARIALLDLKTGRKQPWKTLQPPDPAGVTDVDLFYPTPDGRAYVYQYQRTLSDLFLVEGLK